MDDENKSEFPVVESFVGDGVGSSRNGHIDNAIAGILHRPVSRRTVLESSAVAIPNPATLLRYAAAIESGQRVSRRFWHRQTSAPEQLSTSPVTLHWYDGEGKEISRTINVLQPRDPLGVFTSTSSLAPESLNVSDEVPGSHKLRVTPSSLADIQPVAAGYDGILGADYSLFMPTISNDVPVLPPVPPVETEPDKEAILRKSLQEVCGVDGMELKFGRLIWSTTEQRYAILNMSYSQLDQEEKAVLDRWQEIVNRLKAIRSKMTELVSQYYVTEELQAEALKMLGFGEAISYTILFGTDSVDVEDPFTLVQMNDTEGTVSDFTLVVNPKETAEILRKQSGDTIAPRHKERSLGGMTDRTLALGSKEELEVLRWLYNPYGDLSSTKDAVRTLSFKPKGPLGRAFFGHFFDVSVEDEQYSSLDEEISVVNWAKYLARSIIGNFPSLEKLKNGTDLSESELNEYAHVLMLLRYIQRFDFQEGLHPHTNNLNWDRAESFITRVTSRDSTMGVRLQKILDHYTTRGNGYHVDQSAFDIATGGFTISQVTKAYDTTVTTPSDGNIWWSFDLTTVMGQLRPDGDTGDRAEIACQAPEAASEGSSLDIKIYARAFVDDGSGNLSEVYLDITESTKIILDPNFNISTVKLFLPTGVIADGVQHTIGDVIIVQNIPNVYDLGPGGSPTTHQIVHEFNVVN